MTTVLASAVQDAAKADKAWQAELNRQRLSRYSAEAHGVVGSHLRHLYNSKIQADWLMHEFFEESRRA